MSDNFPEGWASTSLKDIALINPRHPQGLDDGLLVTFVPMASLSDSKPQFQSTEFRPLGEVRKGFTHFAEGDVLFAKITPSMENGKGAVARGLRNQIGCATTEVHVIRPLADISPEYVYWFLAQDWIRSAAKKNFTGTAGQARVPARFMEELEIPLAPLAEQRRIAARLEVLFGKLDSSRERLDRIPALLERLRQSILGAACSGRLTADWREENPLPHSAVELLSEVEHERKKAAAKLKGRRRDLPAKLDVSDLAEIPELWKWATLDQIVEEGRPIIYGIIKPGSHDPKGVPYVRVVEMKDGKIAPISELKRTSPERAAKFRRATLKAGDLLISKDGTIGRVAVVPPELEGGNITQHLVRASIHPLLSRRFVVWAIRSQHSQNWLVGEKKGVALQGVNVEDFRRLPLPIPPLAEQEEIVRRVEALFALADQIEARYARVKAQVDRLAQSLLAKAFRGELVPTEAELARRGGRDYEDARVLLPRVSRGSDSLDGGRSDMKRSRRRPSPVRR